jgi:signal transduction histidine kinase
MGVYEKLSAIPFARKSYIRKFLLIAFVGIHIPIIGIAAYMLYANVAGGPNTTILLVALGFTLVSTGVSLPFLNKLLQPLMDATEALAAASEGKERPSLPTQYYDEVGSLLQQIQTTLDDKDQAIADRDSLFDIISHDFRAPINRIIGLCNLYDCSTEEERYQYFQIIHNEANNLLRDMTQLLTTLKASANAGKNSVVNLAEVAAAAVASVRGIAAEKEITILEDTQKTCIVRADPFLIGQAIKNIITNAIKYSGSGRTVYVRVANEDTVVKLFVTDEGIGFDPADAQKLSDRFTTNTRSGTNGEATNGLGLSIVKRIVARSGGSLTAYSEGTGKGATFTVTLPAVT